MTRLTVSIVADSVGQAVCDIKRAKSEGAEAVEIRLDYLIASESELSEIGLREISSLAEINSLPVIWTLRHESEGGKFNGDIASQLSILAEAIRVGGDYIDIEHRRWERASKSYEEQYRNIIKLIKQINQSGRDVKIILSFHDFEGTPHYIADIAKRIGQDDYADIVKVACRVNDICENFYMLDLLDESNRPMIAIGMGEPGIISRILSKKFGSEVTFSAIEEGRASAPGQLTVRELKSEYNWEMINRDTKIAGVVGHPIKHSLSPVMHNRAYRLMDVNALYLRFDVSADYANFATFIDFIRERPEYDFIGLSITIPHKTNAIEYLRKHEFGIDSLAEKIGAVNTLVFLPDNRLAGYNTDYLGVLESLRAVGGIDVSSLRNVKVAVLGAGGVAKAIVAAMRYAGADVVIYNRTESKARDLANQFDCRYASWDRRDAIEADIIINGTSIGMLGNENMSPLDNKMAENVIKPGMIVFDTVYNPLETKLLKLARERGAKTIDGVNMLVYQAIEQIKLWLEAWQICYNEIPVSAMKRVVLGKLKSG